MVVAVETNTKRLDGRLPICRNRFPPPPLSTRHGVTVTCFRAAQLVPDVVYRQAIATRGHLIATANVLQSPKSDVFIAKGITAGARKKDFTVAFYTGQ